MRNPSDGDASFRSSSRSASRPPLNKALQLTPNSSFQSIRGTVLATGTVRGRWRSALLGAAEPHIRWAASEGTMQARYAAIVFDLFGTLVPVYRHHEVLLEMARLLGADPQDFIESFAITTRDAREIGEVSLAENLRQICRHSSLVVSDRTIQRAVTVRREFTARALLHRVGALEILRELKINGFGIGLISDCCEVVSHLWESTALSSCVDAATLSCRVGIRKPDRRIYELTCEALSTEPNRCLYVGDGGSHELSGAVAVGMDAILLRIPQEASLDPYRPDARTWTGRVVESLGQVLPLAKADRRST